jgi:hypothetical protein
MSVDKRILLKVMRHERLVAKMGVSVKIDWEWAEKLKNMCLLANIAECDKEWAVERKNGCVSARKWLVVAFFR